MNRWVLSASWVATAALCLLCSPFGITAADQPQSPPPGPAQLEETNSLELLRAYAQMQEQLHQAQLAIEATRQETRDAAVKTADALATQLKSIETALATQRAKELDAMQSSNRVMLFMAGTFAALGLAAMVLMAYFQWRTVNGLAGISAALPAPRALGAPILSALGPGDSISASAAQSSDRLLDALEQLERRIYGLEQSRRPALRAAEPAVQNRTNDGLNGNGSAKTSPMSAGEEQTEPGGGLSLKDLLVQGQELLDQDDPTGALAKFESALDANPNHPEALVKKGSALERLGRLQQALECYDQAVRTDSTFTVAYLHKGGLYNRMQKFTEALECYEKALGTQESR